MRQGGQLRLLFIWRDQPRGHDDLCGVLDAHLQLNDVFARQIEEEARRGVGRARQEAGDIGILRGQRVL